MDTSSLKIDIIHWLTQLNDKTVLEKVRIIKEETIELSPSQQNELERRLAKHQKGELKFKSWEETKASIRKRSKNAL